VFIYTSGTTGFPKGVMHSQRALLLAGEGFVQRMFLQPDDRLLCILPMFHINALFYSLAGALAAGATLILVPKFSASAFWGDVARTRATEANTIAAVSTILMRRPRSEFVPGHALRKIYGAPFSAETYAVFAREFGVPTLIEGYGMSEIPGALNNPFEGPHKIGSMGKPSVHPDPSVHLAELRIVDEAGRELPDGQTGELVVKTPLVMLGYYRDPEQTRVALRDGWFLTGDLAWRDADGYFWFVARKKDIIRKRGENISGAELDRVLESHPLVLQAAAIAVPDALGEDEILIAVTLRAGATLTAQAVGQWCRDRLAPIKVPRYVVFVDALPQTPTHRVAKYRLRGDDSLRARAADLEAPRCDCTQERDE
jgi:crotonobetaine/carnitine-CoA ligase